MEDAAVPSDSMDPPAHAHTSMSAFKAAAAKIESALVAAEEHARENSAKEAAAADDAPRSKKKKNQRPSKEAKKAHGDADATPPRTDDVAGRSAAPASFATSPPASLAEPGRHVATDAHNASAVAHLKQKPRAKVIEEEEATVLAGQDGRVSIQVPATSQIPPS